MCVGLSVIVGTALSVCLCLCVRECVCLFLFVDKWGTDAERCVLIFTSHWAPLAAMLDFPDVTHVLLLSIQIRNNSVGWSKWHVYSLHISPQVSQRLCHSSCHSLFCSLLALNQLETTIQFVSKLPQIKKCAQKFSTLRAKVVFSSISHFGLLLSKVANKLQHTV